MKQLVDLPDIGSLTEFVHKEVLHDGLVRKSVGAGYMTEEELVVGRYITKFLDLNYIRPEGGREMVEKDPAYVLVLFDACLNAATMFGITNEKAKEVYLKSLDIRAIQIEDFPLEYFQWPGNKKEV